LCAIPPSRSAAPAARPPLDILTQFAMTNDDNPPTRGRRGRIRRLWYLLALLATCAIMISRSNRISSSYLLLASRSSSSGHHHHHHRDSSSNNNNGDDEDETSCLRAREDAIPQNMRGPNYLSLPVINLGMPKMGSSSLQYFFGCAGYGSSHWWCGGKEYDSLVCAKCIHDSVKGGSELPFDKCGGGPIYTQIDGGWVGRVQYFPQVELLDLLVNAYPNGTFLLTFRDMVDWHRSLMHWTPKTNKRPLDKRMMNANITGLVADVNDDESEQLRDFTNFFCDHVNRVREIVPRHRLVEINIDDMQYTGTYLSEVFDVDESCWKRTNVNDRIHDADHGDDDDDDDDGDNSIASNKTVATSTTTKKNVDNDVKNDNEQVSDTIRSKAKIRGRGGILRDNPTHYVDKKK
jgi:hypothetical protein